MRDAREDKNMRMALDARLRKLKKDLPLSVEDQLDIGVVKALLRKFCNITES